MGNLQTQIGKEQAQERIDQTAREVLPHVLVTHGTSVKLLDGKKYIFKSAEEYSYDHAEALELERAKRIAARKGEE